MLLGNVLLESVTLFERALTVGALLLLAPFVYGGWTLGATTTTGPTAVLRHNIPTGDVGACFFFTCHCWLSTEFKPVSLMH
jgi:hypothetical protein